jgi:hypothetical protein
MIMVRTVSDNLKGIIMNKIINTLVLSLGVSFFLCFAIQANNFQIINNTDFPLQILWKSNGLGPETRSGKFALQPGRVCAACIETYDDNCVHILYVQTPDGKYKARSKPFCKDSEIVIAMKTIKNLLGQHARLDIEIQDSQMKAKS